MNFQVETDTTFVDLSKNQIKYESIIYKQYNSRGLA